MTIGQVAARAGVAPSALRWYEQQGLISASRTAGGARRYPRSTLRRLSFIRAAQNVGLSLAEIRAHAAAELAGLPEHLRSLEEVEAGATPYAVEIAPALRRLAEIADEELERAAVAP